VPLRTKAKYVLMFLFLNLITYFSIQYFITTGNYDLLTSIDIAIPFVPEFIWVYHTLIPVLTITLLILLHKKEVFLSAFMGFIIATIVLSLFYILFPSFYPRSLFDQSSMSAWLLEITRAIDGPHNTFPSGHVTFSWLLGFFIMDSSFAKNNKWIKSIYFAWALLISISTLLLKQHYIIDVASGIILAIVCYFIGKKIIYGRLRETI